MPGISDPVIDALIQKILFLAGGAAVIFGACYGIYSLWEEHTISGRCFAGERKLEQHRFGMDMQHLLNLSDVQANKKRSVELCFVEDGACFDGFAPDLQDFCNSELTSGD